MPYPGAKVIAIPINQQGVASPPASTEVGDQYTAIQFSAAKGGPVDQTLLIENIKLFADQAKTKEVTSQYFHSQEFWGGYNRVCHFPAGLKVPKPVTLWYQVFYKDKGIEHDTDPTVTLDPRGG